MRDTSKLVPPMSQVTTLGNPAAPAICWQAITPAAGPDSAVRTGRLAALSTLNPEITDAARIDGANPWQNFRYVVFPHIKAIAVVLLIYNALTAFTSYDIVYAMTGGGPGMATTLLSFQIWKESFSMYDFGAGAAVAFIVVAISALLILAIVKAFPSDLFKEG